MICTKKLLEAFEQSQKARADRVIRRHARPGAQSAKGVDEQKIADVSQRSGSVPHHRPLLAGASS
jgi:hypothetical protein